MFVKWLEVEKINNAINVYVLNYKEFEVSFKEIISLKRKYFSDWELEKKFYGLHYFRKYYNLITFKLRKPTFR